MKVKVNAGLLAQSLRKVTVNGNNAFCLTADASRKDKDGKVPVMVSSSVSGDLLPEIQAMKAFEAILLKEDGANSVLLGKEFPKAVFAMENLNKDVYITTDENSILVSNGDAEITVPVAENFKSISINQNEKMLGVVMERKQLQRAIKKGAAYTPEADGVVAKGAVQAKVVPEGLRIMSTNFERGAFCEVPVVGSGYIGSEEIKESVEGSFAFRAKLLDMILPHLSEPMVQLVFAETMATLTCGRVSYTWVLMDKKYPDDLEKLLLNRSESIKVTVDKKEFLTAVDLADIVSEPHMPLIVELMTESIIMVRDVNGAAKSVMPASITGTIAGGKIGLNQYNFKVIRSNLDTGEDGSFTFSTDARAPIYFTDCTPDSVSFMMPIDLSQLK